MMGTRIEGQQVKPEEAKKIVDDLYTKMHARWEEKVTKHPFMVQLMSGTLPIDAIRLYYQNWAGFVMTINTLALAVYYKQIELLKQDFNLMRLFAMKITDEFGSPEPPGHILVLLRTGKALGLSEDELLRGSLLPSARALGDFHRAVVWEGALVDYWASVVWEEAMGYYAKAWMEALTKHYGLSKTDAIYFNAHYEADLMEHEGKAAHSSIIRTILQSLLERGFADERLGFGLEYCAVTPADLNGLMLDAVLQALQERRT
jgi:pyrroloquinoline quinone (PQQ) biosynthesis protein C